MFLSCLFNLHAEYIMGKVRLNKAQATIKITGRNINNLKYAVHTTFMAESEEQSQKAGLKLNIQKAKIVASGPITSWQIDG